jgi:uncharacterized membrane protein
MSSVVQRLAFELQGAHGTWGLVLAALALVVLVALGVRSVLGAERRRVVQLSVLRGAQALLVVLLALQPALRRESVAVSAAPVAVIVDTSASMSVRETEPGSAASLAQTSRLQRAGRFVASHGSELDALEKAAVVEWFAAADGGLRPITRAEVEAGTLEPTGRTDLMGSLDALAERHPGHERPAVLLLSDGADHGVLAELAERPEDLARRVPKGGPIVAVAPEPGGLSDVAIDLVAHDPVGFLRTDVTIRARVRATGVGAQDVPVTLMRGDEIVTVRSVRVGGEAGDSADLTFHLSPTRVGESLYRLRVPVTAGEAVSSNNEATFSVRVVRDRIRVLQIVGRPSWDGRFLRELLKRDPAIDLISFFILRTQWDDPNADVDELSLIPFPIQELFDEKIEGFDLVIFQDFSFAIHSIEPYLDLLARHVKDDGAALCVVGGDLALGEDYAGPDIGPVLPVTITRPEWVRGDFRMKLTEVGARHPVLHLGEGDETTADLVAELLPVQGLDVGITPKQGAQVLLETREEPRRPVLVTGEHGHGRVMVLATDGSWQWSLPMAGKPGGARAYERFWQASLRWLVRDERSALVLLDAERRSVAPGEGTDLRVRVLDDRYAPRAKEPVTLRIHDAAAALVREEKLQTGDDGVAHLFFEPPRPGLFAVTAETSRGEAGPLYVESVDRSAELSDPQARPELLRALVEATGGKLVSLSDDHAPLPLRAEREERVESVEILPLWRTWWAWALVAGTLCVEWWLRRKSGLA